MTSKRLQIIEKADQLFYQQGFENTSFADIAEKVKISRGNFYHHFKSKNEILSAVIEHRILKTEKMLEIWEYDESEPEGRIKKFIYILVMNWSKIKLYGCPVGTLTSELAKLRHPARKEANQIFSLFQTWLEKQFIQLGNNNKNAKKHAMHLLARSQGIATLANAFRDEEFINREVQDLISWFQNLSQS